TAVLVAVRAAAAVTPGAAMIVAAGIVIAIAAAALATPPAAMVNSHRTPAHLILNGSSIWRHGSSLSRQAGKRTAHDRKRKYILFHEGILMIAAPFLVQTNIEC